MQKTAIIKFSNKKNIINTKSRTNLLTLRLNFTWFLRVTLLLEVETIFASRDFWEIWKLQKLRHLLLQILGENILQAQAFPNRQIKMKIITQKMGDNKNDNISYIWSKLMFFNVPDGFTILQFLDLPQRSYKLTNVSPFVRSFVGSFIRLLPGLTGLTH